MATQQIGWPEPQPETSMAAQCINCGMVNMLWFDPDHPTSTLLTNPPTVPRCLACNCSLRQALVLPVPR
jgi:hypothetical protein